MTREQDNKNFNPNPFVAGAAIWQTSMTYWLNAPKMTEDWYDVFWKPWLNWMPQQQERQDKDRVKVE